MPIDGLPGGDFDGCVAEMTGEVDDPQAFCAAKIFELTGKHPAQEGDDVEYNADARTYTVHERATERVKLTDIEPGEGPYPGAIWNVTLIGPDPTRENSVIEIEGQEYILSANGLPYSTKALKNEAHKFEGCHVYDNHLTDKEFDERGGMRSFRDELTGAIVGVRYDESARKLQGQYRVGDRAYAQKLADFHELGILADSAGLSIDTFPTYAKVRHEGKRLDVAAGFKEINSTDVVTKPAAGGSLDRRIAATQKQEVNMSELTDETKAFIAQAVAEALAAPTPDAEQVEGEVTPEEVGDVVMEEVAAIVDATDDPEEAAAAIVEVVEEIAAEVAEVAGEAPPVEESADVAALQKQVQAMEAKLAQDDKDRALEAALDAAKLGNQRPVLLEAFRGTMWKGDKLKTAIQRAKEAQSSSDTTGQVTGAGGGRLLNTRGSMSPMDQATIGFMQILASRGDFAGIGSLEDIEQIGEKYVKSRMPEAVRAWRNSGRDNYRPWDGKLTTWLQQMCGYNPLNLRAKEANDVASITKNTVNLFLAASYSMREEWWEPITRQVTVDTLDTTTLVRTYGLNNLSQVAKGGPYTDLEISDDEETATFQKYGNTVSVALEDMLDDKLNVISQIPQQLSDSWYNTKSALASGVFTVNTATGPVLTDTGALFNATATTSTGGHANLLTAALSFTAFGAARTAMRKQTTQKLGAGRRLLITPKYLMIPADLETTAEQIQQSEKQTGTANNDINPYKGKFEIIMVPDWTDTNNWALVGDPTTWPGIYDIRVRGYEVPQVFTAGDESSGAVFTNDTWKYKTRLMTFVFSSTYECLPVSDSRALHKSNV